MATVSRKPAADKASATAMALVDLLRYGVKAGQLLQASAQLVDALQLAGEVDPHPDAVAGARQRGAAVVNISPSE